MKLLSRLILTMFITFLSTPTIVTLIENNSDTTLFFSYTEKENHKDIKEVKAEVKQQFDYPFINFKLKNVAIISKNLVHHDNIASEIFSPPPELI